MAVKKIQFDGNTLIDLTSDTVGTNTGNVINGYTFHGSDGVVRTGSATALNGETRSVTQTGKTATYTPSTGKNAITSITVTEQDATFANVTTSTESTAVPIISSGGYANTTNISALTIPSGKTLTTLTAITDSTSDINIGTINLEGSDSGKSNRYATINNINLNYLGQIDVIQCNDIANIGQIRLNSSGSSINSILAGYDAYISEINLSEYSYIEAINMHGSDDMESSIDAINLGEFCNITVNTDLNTDSSVYMNSTTSSLPFLVASDGYNSGLHLTAQAAATNTSQAFLFLKASVSSGLYALTVSGTSGTTAKAGYLPTGYTTTTTSVAYVPMNSSTSLDYSILVKNVKSSSTTLTLGTSASSSTTPSTTLATCQIAAYKAVLVSVKRPSTSGLMRLSISEVHNCIF